MTRIEAANLFERYVGNECYTDKFQEACAMAIAALKEQDVTDTNVGRKTNADHIRSMTDEELKLYLCSLSGCPGCNWGAAGGCDLEDWLKQTYKEDA